MSKNETLGMPHGTASARLRKSILFFLLKSSGFNQCFQCKNDIETEDDLSIEHIIPWENKENGKELFFDLENIAFSHLKCNRPNRPFHGGDTSKAIESRIHRAPPGMAWCSGHEEFMPIEEFHKRSNRWNGVDRYCKTCAYVMVKNSPSGKKKYGYVS